MWYRSLFHSVSHRSSSDPARQAPHLAERKPAGRPVHVEPLEERLVLSSVTVADVAVTEGDAGVRQALVTVRLSQASSKAVTVNYRTADGTATAGSDYRAATGKLTFAAGETLKTFSVSVVGDGLAEPDECFSVKLSGAKNARIGDAHGVVTIADDEPRLRVNDVSMVEGDAGDTLFAFTVNLSAASAAPVAVDFSTADGTATAADGDYVPAAGTLTFAPGETSKTVLIAAVGDSAWEPDETFFLNLGGDVNAFLADPHAAGRIVSDDPWIVEPDPQEPCMVNCGVDGDGGWSGVAT